MKGLDKLERVLRSSRPGDMESRGSAVKPLFTSAELDSANDRWGCNCGPGAFAAVLGLTLDETRRHFGPDFEAKRYTNPTLMFAALNSTGRKWSWSSVMVSEQPPSWPTYGLCRIQWEGPWTKPGVPLRARYRYTHWVGVAVPVLIAGNVLRDETNIGIFDVNAISNGTGWCSLSDWTSVVIPFITASYKRASGGWHITHAIEVDPSR